jgi:hypothetical protein
MTRGEFSLQIEMLVSPEKVGYMVLAEKQEPPFILYALPDNDDFHADNQRYFFTKNGWLELYMTEMDFDLMEAIEQVFITNKLPWEKEYEIYIDNDDAKVFVVRWNFQLIQRRHKK